MLVQGALDFLVVALTPATTVAEIRYDTRSSPSFCFPWRDAGVILFWPIYPTGGVLGTHQFLTSFLLIGY